MSSSDFLKLQWVMPTCYPQEEHVQKGPVLLICSFAATNGNTCTGNFRAS